jgi:hypothetical protein
MEEDWSELGCGFEVGMQSKRPETSCCDALKRFSIPVAFKFLSWHCLQAEDQQQQKGVFTGSMLLSSLQDWARDRFLREKITSNTLGEQLGKIAKVQGSGVEKNRSGGVSKYVFKWAELRNYLQRENLFDSEVL